MLEIKNPQFRGFLFPAHDYLYFKVKFHQYLFSTHWFQA